MRVLAARSSQIGFFLVLLLGVLQQAQAQPIFSFLVVGDTRTEAFLPGGPDQEQVMRDVLAVRYGEKARSARLYFDEKEEELLRVEVTDQDGSLLALNYRGGWPNSILRTQKGQSKVIMRENGRQWVFKRIISTIKKGADGIDGGAQFLLHAGDIPLFGLQGRTVDSNPYWQLFEDELLRHIPPPDRYLRLPGRVFAAVGNHGSWLDEELSGFISAMPWLAQFGFQSERRIYAFTFRNTHFIFLDSGGYSSDGLVWESEHPPFEEQMDFLTKELDDALRRKIRHVFIVYHKPSFVRVGHDPLPKDQNPHEVLKHYGGKLNIFVFNSHAHTTEQYDVDNIHYLVLGAGGAPQKFELTSKPSNQRELYWQGLSRVEEYSFLEVQVDGHMVKGLLHRFRPTQSANPFEVVEMFKH